METMRDLRKMMMRTIIPIATIPSTILTHGVYSLGMLCCWELAKFFLCCLPLLTASFCSEIVEVYELISYQDIAMAFRLHSSLWRDFVRGEVKLDTRELSTVGQRSE